jgi:hypothetical protein
MILFRNDSKIYIKGMNQKYSTTNNIKRNIPEFDNNIMKETFK